MATNQKASNPENMESIEEVMSKTELFFEKNGKKISYLIFALLIAAALIFGYKVLVMEPQSQRGAEMIANAQNIFEQATPNYDAALNGDENGAGFLEVIENYGSTPAGNIAKHYAGVCYLQLGDLENAAKYLAQYSAVDGIPAAIVNAQNAGLMGDIAVEIGDFAKATTLYSKAIKASDNILTTPMYMRKAALVAIELGENAAAKELLEAIKSNYPNSIEARDVEKYIGAINN